MNGEKEAKKKREKKFCFLGHWCFNEDCVFWDSYTNQCFILRLMKSYVYQRRE